MLSDISVWSDGDCETDIVGRCSSFKDVLEFAEAALKERPDKLAENFDGSDQKAIDNIFNIVSQTEEKYVRYYPNGRSDFEDSEPTFGFTSNPRGATKVWVVHFENFIKQPVE